MKKIIEMKKVDQHNKYFTTLILNNKIEKYNRRIFILFF
jgi:hypothetical protein